MDNLISLAKHRSSPPDVDIEAAVAREREAAVHAVENSPPLERCVTFMPAAQKVLAWSKAELEKTSEFIPEVRATKAHEIREKRDEKLAGLLKQYNEDEQQLLDTFRPSRVDAHLTPEASAKIQAFGPVLRDLTPESFMEVLEGAIQRRERGLLTALVPVAETYAEVRKPYAAHAVEMGTLIDQARLAMKDESTLAAEYAAEVAEGLRDCVELFATELVKTGNVNEVFFHETEEGRTAMNAFTSRMEADE